MKVLHLHGGTALLDGLSAQGIPGDQLSWSDALCRGPTPQGLERQEWYAVRAAWLDEATGGDHRDELAAQDERLEGLHVYDEVVLWSGPDLFCQAILVRLLDAFSRKRPLVPLFLARACDADDDLAAAYDARERVGAAHYSLARAGWDALTWPSPVPLQRLVDSRRGALPDLRDALLRHLRDLPSVGSGLGLTERRILAAARRERDPVALFEAFQAQEEHRWLTDLLFAAELRRLASGPMPLLALPEVTHLDPLAAHGPVRTTVLGDAALAGQLDWLVASGAPRWHGGIWIDAAWPWRWDEATRRLTVIEAA